jgi:two-component system LytT family sensor kinase
MHSSIKRLFEIILHLLFWVGVFYVLTSLNSSHIHMRLKTHFSIYRDQFEDQSISSYVYLILGFLVILFYGNIFWVLKKAIRYKNGLLRLAIGGGWFIAVFGANYFLAGPLFNKANPLSDLPPLPQSLPHHTITKDVIVRIGTGPGPREFPKVGMINFMISDWAHLQMIILIIFLAILGISIAYFFLKEWSKSELIQTQLQANQLSTEIKFLKSQINPHFLFNTLNNLFSMAQAKGNDELADGISKLSGMMRYMLYDSNAESVLLGTEIAYLEECITLNKLRYADEEVTVIFDHPAQANGITIAPMLFIPFVENAFKYGVAIGQKTSVKISITVSAQNLTFTCENTNFSAIKQLNMEKSGIGLENVKRRLQLLYPGKHHLQITNTDEKFIVNLEINLA